MKLTYAFTREALKAEAFDGELKKKSGNIPAKREKETVAAVLRKLQLNNKNVK